MRSVATAVRGLLMALLLLSLGSGLFAQPLPGAIFTTDSTGTVQNQNLYAAKTDVYLNGQQLPPSPPNYYVQVTDPSGQVVLGRSDGAVLVVESDGTFGPTWLWSLVYQTNDDGSFPSGPLVQGFKDTPNNGGEYKVWISLDADFKQAESKTDNFKVRAPSMFGLISGYKFFDKDQEGDWDTPEEPGLPGWTIVLTDSMDNTMMATTGADGSYAFDNLVPGTYTISEVLQAGWTQTAPGGNGTYTVTITSSGEVVTDRNFGNFRADFEPACIVGYKFKDCNCNGRWDPGEPGLAGWTIILTDTSGNERTAVTNSSGRYFFDDVEAGTYTLSEEQQTGWVQTAPGGNGTYTVVINTSGQVVRDRNFGNAPKTKPVGKICGFMFYDTNANGRWDKMIEPPLRNCPVLLYDEYGRLVKTALTNEMGFYLMVATPGRYLVKVRPPNSYWKQTCPNPTLYGGGYRVLVQENLVLRNKNFGYLYLGPR